MFKEDVVYGCLLLGVVFRQVNGLEDSQNDHINGQEKIVLFYNFFYM